MFKAIVTLLLVGMLVNRHWVSYAGSLSLLHFDSKDVICGGNSSKFEFCDFLDPKAKTLYFTKIASKPSGMSHLVEQVRRTAELLFAVDQTYRDELSKVYKKVPPQSQQGLVQIVTEERRMVFLHCVLRKIREDLPFFAKCGGGTKS